MSVPIAISASPVATATADPELDPPLMYSGLRLSGTAPYGDRVPTRPVRTGRGWSCRRRPRRPRAAPPPPAHRVRPIGELRARRGRRQPARRRCPSPPAGYRPGRPARVSSAPPRSGRADPHRHGDQPTGRRSTVRNSSTAAVGGQRTRCQRHAVNGGVTDGAMHRARRSEMNERNQKCSKHRSPWSATSSPIRNGDRVGDQEVIKFRVASNSRRRTADGNWEPGNSLFVTVNCWGRLVTGVGAALGKGAPVIVVGTCTPASTRTVTASAVRRWKCGPPRWDRMWRAASCASRSAGYTGGDTDNGACRRRRRGSDRARRRRRARRGLGV